MARLTVKTSDGEVHEYTTRVAGNLSSGFLILCGEDGPAYLGRGGFVKIQAHLSSCEYGHGSHCAFVVADGQIKILPAVSMTFDRVKPWSPDIRSEVSLNTTLASIVERKINGEDIGHPLSYYVRHLTKRTKKHIEDLKREGSA